VTNGRAETAPKETLTYEQARDKLAAVVKRLEAGGLTLEQSLELWERGARARLAAAMAKRDDSEAAASSAEDDAPF
jgi:exodeoxyribonuclease VII small subunit